MGLAAAVVGAAAIGAVGSIGGSIMQSNAASKAAGEQSQSANNALATQKAMFNTANNALNPYYTAPGQSQKTLQALLNPGTATSTLESLPGFQFQSQWGDIGATNALAAQGLGGSTGPLAKAISDYNNGLASTYYGNYVNGLQNSVNQGSNAASALAGSAISSGNSQAQSQITSGNDIAAGTLGSANALAGGLSGGLGGASNALLLSSLMGGGSSGGLYGNLGNNASLLAQSGGANSGNGFSLGSF